LLFVCLDDYEPFHVDLNKQREHKKSEPNSETKESNDDSSENPVDTGALRQLHLKLLPRVYAAVFISGVTIYLLGKWTREKKSKDESNKVINSTKASWSQFFALQIEVSHWILTYIWMSPARIRSFRPSCIWASTALHNNFTFDFYRLLVALPDC